jgi:hypothetical protein
MSVRMSDMRGNTHPHRMASSSPEIWNGLMAAITTVLNEKHKYWSYVKRYGT